MTIQRYVSRELTHFVGRGKAIQEQHATLNSILRSGWITKHPDSPGVSSPVNIDGSFKMSENQMFNADAICFCDIPTDDLELHMGKYSRFGISFLKSFLVSRGANPVFYIANDSIIPVRFEAGKPREEVPRGNILDEVAFNFVGLLVERRAWEKAGHPLPPEVADHFQRMRRPTDFLLYHVFSHMKCFDSQLADNDPKNYYLEREWRMVRDLQFRLDDVWRVILPKEFAAQFRRDFPEYHGQVAFAESG